MSREHAESNVALIMRQQCMNSRANSLQCMEMSREHGDSNVARTFRETACF